MKSDSLYLVLVSSLRRTMLYEIIGKDDSGDWSGTLACPTLPGSLGAVALPGCDFFHCSFSL